MAAPFSAAEYQRRKNQVIASMREKDIETLIVVNHANITYLTGYPAIGSAYVPQAVVVDSVSDDIHLICRPMDRLGIIATSILRDEQLTTYPEALIGCEDPCPHSFIYEHIAATFPKRIIGLEFDQASQREMAIAEQELGAERLRDGSGIVNWVRFIKSDEEIEVHRQAGLITDEAIRVAQTTIKSGLRQSDAAAAIMASLCRGTEEFPGDWPSYPEIPSGDLKSAPHVSWTNGDYAPETQINCELGGWRHRYVSPLARTLTIGAPNDRLRYLHDATAEGLGVILPMMRPGVACSEIWQAYNDTIAKHGFHKSSRCGYAVGIEWDGAAASFRPDDNTLLESNMMFHVMIGMWNTPEESCVLSETAFVSPTGGVSYSKIPREILVCGD